MWWQCIFFQTLCTLMLLLLLWRSFDFYVTWQHFHLFNVHAAAIGSLAVFSSNVIRCRFSSGNSSHQRAFSVSICLRSPWQSSNCFARSKLRFELRNSTSRACWVAWKCPCSIATILASCACSIATIISCLYSFMRCFQNSFMWCFHNFLSVQEVPLCFLCHSIIIFTVPPQYFLFVQEFFIFGKLRQVLEPESCTDARTWSNKCGCANTCWSNCCIALPCCVFVFLQNNGFSWKKRSAVIQYVSHMHCTYFDTKPPWSQTWPCMGSGKIQTHPTHRLRPMSLKGQKSCQILKIDEFPTQMAYRCKGQSGGNWDFIAMHQCELITYQLFFPLSHYVWKHTTFSFVGKQCSLFSERIRSIKTPACPSPFCLG